MSNQNNHINWEHIEELKEKWGVGAIFQMYGGYEGVDPTHSFLLDDTVDIQPPWQINKKVAVTTAIVGAMYNKRFNPNQPMSPEEIYNSA